MATLLIAEDDDNLRLLLSRQLSSHYDILKASDGLEALKILDNHRVDLLITDILMPGLDGYDLVQSLRDRGAQIPVIMLTANQSFDAKRTGFSSGTDDYLTKPFDREELLWRVQALLRRLQIDQDCKVIAGNIVADLSTYRVTCEDKDYELPRKEFKLLYKLISQPGRIFTKTQLFEDIWGYDSESTEDTIKTHISRLRNRLQEINDISIVAVKGVGYKAEVQK